MQNDPAGADQPGVHLSLPSPAHACKGTGTGCLDALLLRPWHSGRGTAPPTCTAHDRTSRHPLGYDKYAEDRNVACPLCGQGSTLRHVLGVCQKAAHLRPLPTTSYGALMEDHAADLLRFLVDVRSGFLVCLFVFHFFVCKNKKRN